MHRPSVQVRMQAESGLSPSTVNSTLLSMRRALMAVTALGLIGLGAELAAVGHWYGPGQLIPFIAIVGTLLCMLLYLVHKRAWTILLLRSVAVLLVLTGLFGALQHTEAEAGLRAAGRANENAAPAETRARPLLGLPVPHDNALNGPAPVSAPLAMSGLGLLLFLSLFRHEQAVLRPGVLPRAGQ